MALESEVAGGRLFPRLHWSAVIAGVCLAIAAHIALGLVGAALGFAAAPAGSQRLGAAAAIWGLITPFVATLLGAWLACRMAGTEDTRSSSLHGILVWCIGLILGAVFLTGTLASGAMSVGTAASGNLGAAQRTFRPDLGTRPGAPAEARQDEAARAAAAGFGGAALASIAGLLGAVVGAGLSRRRSAGKGKGWRIAIHRPEEARPGQFAGQERGYPGTTYPAPPPRTPGMPGSPDVGMPPTDPYHH